MVNCFTAFVKSPAVNASLPCCFAYADFFTRFADLVSSSSLLPLSELSSCCTFRIAAFTAAATPGGGLAGLAAGRAGSVSESESESESAGGLAVNLADAGLALALLLSCIRLPPPPAARQMDAASACFWRAAVSPAASPFSSFTVGSAPARASSDISAICPFPAAACKAVAPSELTALGSALAVKSSHSTTSVSPRAAAQCSAVCPMPVARK
mmetsp:Transcript_36312/g.89459  ORF Transcript_36312/g.89459 Transcript_36312/m.89459 type:complete len:212 (-) Transcript_36312:169-804(-)